MEIVKVATINYLVLLGLNMAFIPAPEGESLTYYRF